MYFLSLGVKGSELPCLIPFRAGEESRLVFVCPLTLPLPSSKSTFSQPFKQKMYKWGSWELVVWSSFIWVSYEKPSSSYCVMSYIWWGCRRNLKLITLGSESVNSSTIPPLFSIFYSLKVGAEEGRWGVGKGSSVFLHFSPLWLRQGMFFVQLLPEHQKLLHRKHRLTPELLNCLLAQNAGPSPWVRARKCMRGDCCPSSWTRAAGCCCRTVTWDSTSWTSCWTRLVPTPPHAAGNDFLTSLPLVSGKLPVDITSVVQRLLAMLCDFVKIDVELLVRKLHTWY